MFTGLIGGIGKVKSIRRLCADAKLDIGCPFSMEEVKVGESISVDGVCLTVTRISADSFEADVSGETLSRSTLVSVGPGDAVNIERALRLSDRLGGHLVSGHVDGIGKILSKQMKERSWQMRIGIEEALSRYTIEKGSIAVDGISLTINRCEKGFFEVNIIPQTARGTTILEKRVGDLVNIETDMIGKYIDKLFSGNKVEKEEKQRTGITLDLMKEKGFGD
jgi:riboflavin synthase